MKIAVPTDDGKSIAPHFGRAGYFAIFEVNQGQVTGKKLVENNPYHSSTSQHNHQEGTRHGHERFISLLEGCSILVARGMGPRAVADLEARGIKPVFTDVENAEEAVKAYVSGTLKECAQFDCGHH